MNQKNHDLPNDPREQAQADVTWTTLESGDRLGQAIKDSLDSQTPDANPKLREMLAERMAESDIPVTKVTRESKLPAQKERSILPRLVLALGVCGLMVRWPGLSLVRPRPERHRWMPWQYRTKLHFTPKQNHNA